MAKTSGNVRGANINHEAIDKARSILKHFDFHWQMVEYGYSEARDRARSQMREFARYARMAGSKKITRQLRKEWVQKYEAARDMRRMF